MRKEKEEEEKDNNKKGGRGRTSLKRDEFKYGPS